MKKLITIVAIAIGVLATQAASVSWTMTNVYGPNGSLNSGTAYMFGYNATDGISRSMIASEVQAAFANKGGVTGVEKLLADNYSWTASDAGKYTDSSKSVDPVADLKLTAGATYNLYVVIFDSATLTAESKFFISTELTNKKVPSGDNNLSLLFGNMTIDSQAEGAWQAIPEPTSGLLLLLGAAGLTLKRKRA